MSVWEWQNKPSQSGKDLKRSEIIRSKATQTVETFREAGINLSTIPALSRKSQILSDRFQGQYTKARSTK